MSVSPLELRPGSTLCSAKLSPLPMRFIALWRNDRCPIPYRMLPPVSKAQTPWLT